VAAEQLRIAQFLLAGATRKTNYRRGRFPHGQRVERTLDVVGIRIRDEPSRAGAHLGERLRAAQQWIGIKAAISGQDEAAVLTECERGEELAVTRYEHALKVELPSETRTIVEAQYRGTVSNLEKVRALGRAYGASKPTIAPTPEREARIR
jgi:hypothetical protein